MNMYGSSLLDMKEKSKRSPVVKVVNFILHKVFRREKRGSLDGPSSDQGSYLSYSEIDLESLSSAMRRTQGMFRKPLTPPLKPPRHISLGADEFWTPPSSARFDFRRLQVSKRIQTKDAAVEACEDDIDHRLDQEDKYSVTYGSHGLQVTPPRNVSRRSKKPPPLKPATIVPVRYVPAEGRSPCPRRALFACSCRRSPERTTDGNARQRPVRHHDVGLTPSVEKHVATSTKENAFLKWDDFIGSEDPQDYLYSEATSSRRSSRRLKGFQKRPCVDGVATTSPRKTHDSVQDCLSRRPATSPGTGKASGSRSKRRPIKTDDRPPTLYSTSYLKAASAYWDMGTSTSKVYRANGQSSLVQGRHKWPKDRGDGSSRLAETCPFSRFRQTGYSGAAMASGDEAALSRVHLRRAKVL
ncbi:uncharacterized protein LOC135366062 [Ornithodoros turicata]|uniref:uncharacterized protein LOC135366062 n=1 Tax=Ornithodoros turicata TaxID=34597 RepID=UPI003139E84F